jgi:hypothetical protein
VLIGVDGADKMPQREGRHGERSEAEAPCGDGQRRDRRRLGEAREDRAEGDRGEADAEDDEGQPAGKVPDAQDQCTASR